MIVIIFHCISYIKLLCCMSLPIPVHLSSFSVISLVFCISQVFKSHIFWLHSQICLYLMQLSLFTLLSTTLFLMCMLPKKSLFLVIRGLFCLHDDLAAFLCTPTLFLLTNSILISTDTRTSSHFKLIGRFPHVERVVIVCLIVLTILSLPVEFIWSPFCVNLPPVSYLTTTLTRCIFFSNLHSFLLKTCVSLFTQEKSGR